MKIFGFKASSKLLASIATASLIAAPVIVLADASAPTMHKMHKAKAKMKKRMRVRSTARQAPAPKPMMAEPAPQVVQAPEPAPPPAPEPAPVAEAAPAPTPPAAPAAPVAVKSSSRALLYVAGIAALGGVIAAVASNSKSKSP